MLLEIRNLRGGYGDRDIIKNVSCQADAGDILFLTGPNGCGKTTLFRMLLGLLPVKEGEILLGGVSAASYSAKEHAAMIAYIPQQHAPVFSFTALEVVLMGRAAHFSVFETPSGKDRSEAFDALHRLRIDHLAHEKYTTLSGGQRQMVLIARAICQSAKIFLMDEPAANLDFANQQHLMETVGDLAKNGYLVIMTTHSPEHPASYGTKVLLMQNGTVAAFGRPAEVITSAHLERVYGIPMDVVSVTDRTGRTRTICLPVGEAS